MVLSTPDEVRWELLGACISELQNFFLGKMFFDVLQLSKVKLMCWNESLSSGLLLPDVSSSFTTAKKQMEQLLGLRD